MSEKLSKDAIKILRKVKRHILAEPKGIRMATWLCKNANEVFGVAPKCNTVGCIGGWIEVFTRGNAYDVLGIGYTPAKELFYEQSLISARHQQTPAHARAVAKHIDKFIAKYR